jgi:RNA polymerase sigma factor (sigma-70 family)
VQLPFGIARAVHAEAAGQSSAVGEALRILNACPYNLDASEEQERACRLLYGTLLTRLALICDRHGLDSQEAADVVHAEFLQFVTRDVGRIAPTENDLARWMSTVCSNAARTALKSRNRRIEQDRLAARQAEIDSEGPEWSDDRWDLVGEDPAATCGEPNWLDARFPRRIDPQRFLAALALLSPQRKRLFDAAFRHIRRDGSGCRLPATAIARELGTTPNTISVRLSELMRDLRALCGETPR